MNRGFFKIVTIFGFLILILLIFTPFTVKADGGYIPVTDVDVFGPGQKAIIAWNGTVESIMLSEDVYSTGDSAVLKIIPLPNNPIYIEEGNAETFHKINSFISQKSYEYKTWDFGDTSTVTPESPFEIVFHEKIKSHDITVIRIDNALHFIDVAEDIIGLLGYEPSISIEVIEDVLNYYMDNDVNYFVFDLVELTPSLMTIEPIIYTFKSNYLYYPMVISSLAEGDTDIILFVFTTAPLNREEFPSGVDYSHFVYKLPILTSGTQITRTIIITTSSVPIRTGDTTVLQTTIIKTSTILIWTGDTTVLQAMQFELSHEELEFLFTDLENKSTQIPEFFEGDSWLSILTYQGSLKSLKSDLKINETLTEWSTVTHEIISIYETTEYSGSSTGYWTFILNETDSTTYTTTFSEHITGTAVSPCIWLGPDIHTAVTVYGPTTIVWSDVPAVICPATTTTYNTTQTLGEVVVLPELSNLIIILIIVLFSIMIIRRTFSKSHEN